MAKGIPLISDDYGHKIEFLYDGINSIKPEMIEEATANARAAAQKFAQVQRRPWGGSGGRHKASLRWRTGMVPRLS